MSNTPNTVDRVETAANIYVQLTYLTDAAEGNGGSLAENGRTIEVPVSELDLTKEVDMERVRETGLYPDGYAINAIDIDGSLTFAGSVVRDPGGDRINLDDVLFKDDGTPKTFDISIVHQDAEAGADGSTDTIENAIINSSEYSVSSGESTESSYEFMAQRLNTAD